MAKVLFVDDQVNILKSLRRTVEDEDCEILTAESAAEGLELLKEHTFEVIFSDVRMPVMDGIEFLAKSKEIQPNCVRIVLSAFADRDQVLDAINRGHVWSYQTKPWDSEDLILILRNAREFYHHQSENRRLTDELKKSNEKLSSMNAELEKRVQERTQELLMREEALTMLLDHKDIKVVWEKIEKDLATISGASEARIFSETPQSFNGNCKEIYHRGKCIGQIGLTEDGSFNKVSGFLPIIEMLLSMNRVLENEDQILDDIDQLIKSLE